MAFVIARKRSVLGLGVLCLISLLAFAGFLRAGDALSLDGASTELANPPLNVREANTDASGNIKVREQGTVTVSGTVNVGNAPATQNVRITNTPLAITGGTIKKYREEFYPFDKDQDIDVDITEFSRVRLRFVVNGSGAVDFFWGTDAIGLLGSVSIEGDDDPYTVLLPEVAGTNLSIELRDPDGEQVFVEVFGTR